MPLDFNKMNSLSKEAKMSKISDFNSNNRSEKTTAEIPLKLQPSLYWANCPSNLSDHQQQQLHQDLTWKIGAILIKSTYL